MLLRTKKPNSEDWKHVFQWQSFLWVDIFVWWLCLCNLMKWSIGQDGGGQMHKSFTVKIKEVSVCASQFPQFPSLRSPLLPGSLVSRALKKKKGTCKLTPRLAGLSSSGLFSLYLVSWRSCPIISCCNCCTRVSKVMIPLWVEHYLYKQFSFLTIPQCAPSPPPFLRRAQKAGSYLKHGIKWKDRQT